MAPKQSIILDSPRALIAAIPHLLGFPPKQSVVAVWLNQREGRPQVALTARYDLPLAGLDDLDVARGYAEQLLAPADKAESKHMILTVWGDEALQEFGGALQLPHQELIGAVRSLAAERGIGVPDVTYTDGDRTWSYNCTDICCGGVAGAQIQEVDRNRVAAEFVVAGKAIQPSREAVMSEFAYTPNPEVVLALNSPPAFGGIFTTTILVAGREMVLSGLRELAERGGPFAPGEVAYTAQSLESIKVRDTFLWEINQQGVDQQPAIQLLTEVVRVTPDEHVAPAATVLGLAHYAAGDGARANACLDRALAADPEYSLAGLLDQVLETGPPPNDMTAGLRNLTRATCLGTDTPAFNPNPATLADLHLAAPAANNSLER